MSTASQLMELGQAKLLEVAKSHGIDCKGMTELQIASAIEKASIKQTLKLEAEAKAELKKERESQLGVSGKKKRRPSIQDVLIQHSRKVECLFLNMEHPAADGEDGADLMFSQGQYSFHLFDNHRFVMPECLVTDDPLSQTDLQETAYQFWTGAGLPDKRARSQAISDLLQMALPRRCSYPVFEQRPDPRDSKNTINVLVRTEPRFRFQIFGTAKPDAELGELVDLDNSQALKTNEQLIAEQMARPKAKAK